MLEASRDPQPAKPAVITAVALAPGGKWVAAAGDDHLVRVWSSETGRLVHTLPGHADWVRSLKFSPDAERLISAGDDHRLIEWRLSDGKQLRILAEHGEPIFAVDYSPSGTWVAAAGFEPGVRVYSSTDGKLVRELLTASKELRTVAFSPDGQHLAAAGRSGQIFLWRTSDWHVELEIPADRMRIRSLAYSPDGKRLAAAGDGRSVGIWDAESGKPLNRLVCRQAKVLTVAFCGDEVLATGGSDNAIRIWDLRAGPAARWQLVGHNGSVAALACDPETGVLVSGSFETTWCDFGGSHASQPSPLELAERQPKRLGGGSPPDCAGPTTGRSFVGLFGNLTRWSGRWLGMHLAADGHATASRLRICRVEEFEERMLMNSDPVPFGRRGISPSSIPIRPANRNRMSSR